MKAKGKRIWIAVQFTAVLLAVAAVAVVSGYAWFTAANPKTAFTVEVRGGADVEVRLYEDWTTATPIASTDAFTFMGEDAFYPGLSLERRIEIVNRGRAATVGVSFIRTSMAVTELTDPDGSATQSLVTYLDAHFFIKVKTAPAQAETDVAFVARAFRGENIPVLASYALAEGATAVVYYRFFLDPATVQQEGAVHINAGGIRVTAS